MIGRPGLWIAIALAASWACGGDDDGAPDDGGIDAAEATDEGGGAEDAAPADEGGGADDATAPDEATADDDAGELDDAGAPEDASPEVPVTDPMPTDTRIVYLHHSTGGVIWGGGVPEAVAAANTADGTSYEITERAYPSGDPYPWENYPYDYWNIWVAHAGTEAYRTEPTLEMLTPEYGVIVFKHCYPVSGIEEDTGSPDVTSSAKTIENYQAQYAALKAKMHEFPGNRFLVWTGAALTAASTNPEQAARAREFFTWVKTTWDEPGDNIFVWDFFELETAGGNVLLDSNAEAPDNSHPNGAFAARVAPLFVARLLSVLRGTGDSTSLTGE